MIEYIKPFLRLFELLASFTAILIGIKMYLFEKQIVFMMMIIIGATLFVHLTHHMIHRHRLGRRWYD